jgi:hypothetical protein
MRQVLKVVLPLLGALFLLPCTAYAQTGSISGQARDASGGALPGVTVEVTSPALIEKIRTSVTDDNGRYQITALPVGTYEVTFTLQSFATVKRANIVITSNFNANVPVEMSVGGLKDTVNVVAESPVVDVQNARVQHVFQGSEIAELPTQRDIPSLLNLVPSFQASSLRGPCSGGVGGFCNPTVPLFNTHTGTADTDGQNQGRIMVDGMSINMGRAGTGINENVGLANGIVLDTAAAQEVSFTLSGSLGESETGGAAINIVPRTGGNRFAGNYFTSYTQTRFFDRNRETRLTWSPTNPNPTTPNNAFNYDYDVTGAFGGPIRKDRLWFYLQTRKQARNSYPGGGNQPGFMNLNEGKWGANYVPNRTCTAPRSCADNGWLTFTNEYKNASARITLQASQKNKFNIYWDEQDACTNPCDGMISIINSPESYFTLQSRPNRLMQLSWTNPYTSRLLFDAGLSVVATHQDQTKSREFTNPRTIPRICEVGPTVGRDGVSSKVNTQVPNNWANNVTSAGTCDVFATMVSGSLNDSFPGVTPNTLVNDDTYRSRASASYITGSHNAKFGFEGAYFSEKIRNEANDIRLNYHYITPATTGTWNATTRTGNCLLAPATDVYACGNMTLYNPEDPTNLNYLRPRPVGFRMNTGVSKTDERVWFGALYLQDQWTLNRFTLNAAVRWDHAESRYGESCIGPDTFVPVDAAQPTGSWCSTPSKGVRFNDITPRWGVAWDVFGNGKTSVKWNMGKYLQAAGFGGLYTNFNDARRSTNNIVRGWDDLNGNRVVECNHSNPNPHTSPQGDFCGTLLGTDGLPSTAFLTFGRAPNANQLANANSSCGLKNSPQLHVDYCNEADQNLMQGWGKRRNEWQFGLGIQHELLPRFSAEVTYNRRKYGNLTDSDTVNLGCDYYGARAASGFAPETCLHGWQNYNDPSGLRDFYSVTVPVDTRLPDGGGYQLRGLTNQKVAAALPTGGGNVTLQRKELDYTWNGVDTNFVLRARGGMRLSGGTSTGRVLRNTCAVSTDTPDVEGRVGNEFRGGCNEYRPFQTNVRANASYTIPFIDVLAGVVFQYRPGPERTADIDIPNTAVQWEAGSEGRAGTLFNTNNGTTATQEINLLDDGDLFGEGLRLWDLNFSKNIRFAGKRLNLGVNVYNLFNSDGATGYIDDYTAFYIPETGTWVSDNPATADVEFNDWGRVDGITSPRFMRFTVSFDF